MSFLNSLLSCLFANLDYVLWSSLFFFCEKGTVAFWREMSSAWTRCPFVSCNSFSSDNGVGVMNQTMMERIKKQLFCPISEDLLERSYLSVLVYKDKSFKIYVWFLAPGRKQEETPN